MSMDAAREFDLPVSNLRAILNADPSTRVNDIAPAIKSKSGVFVIFL